MGMTAKADAKLNPIVQNEFEEEIGKLSMGDLMKLANGPQSIVDHPERFDPDTVLGDLAVQLTDDPEKNAILLEQLKIKTDNTNSFIESMEAYASRKEWRGNRELEQASIARNMVYRIKERFEYVMRTNGFEEIRGYKYAARFTKNTWGNCETVYYRQPTAADHLKWPDLVKEVPVTYKWNTSDIKMKLKDFYRAINEQPACEVCKGRKTVVTESEVVDCTDCHGTGKEIPEGLEVPVVNSFSCLEWNPKLVFDDVDEMPAKAAKKGKKK